MTLLRTARVFTALGDDVLLFFSMDGTDAMGQPFEYEVELLSMDEQIDFTSSMRASAGVSAPRTKWLNDTRRTATS